MPAPAERAQHERMTTPSAGFPSEELTRLIQHGRDREAAELAARRLRADDPRDQLREILPRVRSLVAALDPRQLDLSSPCDELDVRGVLEHMIAGARQLSGATNADERPADPIAEFPIAMAALEASMATADEGTARFVALDGLVHGWDLATATGQSYDPPAEVVEAVDAFARTALAADRRDLAAFHPAVEPPDDATPLVRLVAFTGRQPTGLVRSPHDATSPTMGDSSDAPASAGGAG